MSIEEEGSSSHDPSSSIEATSRVPEQREQGPGRRLRFPLSNRRWEHRRGASMDRGGRRSGRGQVHQEPLRTYREGEYAAAPGYGARPKHVQRANADRASEEPSPVRPALAPGPARPLVHRDLQLHEQAVPRTAYRRVRQGPGARDRHALEKAENPPDGLARGCLSDHG